MTTQGSSDWGNKPIVVLIGVISGLIAIFAFLTGKETIWEIVGGVPTSKPTVTRLATATFTPTSPTPTPAPPTPTDTPEPPAQPPPTPMPMPTATPIPTRVREKDNAKVVYVPAGDFTMGNDQGYNGKIFADQRPEHPVDLDAFWIDKLEITNAKYQDCVAAGECKAPDLGEDASRFNQDEQPVVRVSWFDAVAYCNWVGARLPTEAEWEKAARGTDKWLFPWGNEFDASKLNFKGQSDAPKPVGSFRDSASPYGALDMSGNVWEWTSSMYKNYPYKYQDGREDMSDEESATRVVRGGAWDEGDDQATTTWRSHFTQGSRFYNTGFRCASSANPGTLQLGVLAPETLKQVLDATNTQRVEITIGKLRDLCNQGTVVCKDHPSSAWSVTGPAVIGTDPLQQPINEVRVLKVNKDSADNWLPGWPIGLYYIPTGQSTTIPTPGIEYPLDKAIPAEWLIR